MPHSPAPIGLRVPAAPHHRSRNIFVVAQVAVALVLLVSALLMIRTFAALRDVDPGFSDPAQLETMRIYIPELLVANPIVVTRMQHEIADKISAIPGVTSVGIAEALPMEGIDPNWDEIGVEGKHYERGEPPLRLFNYVCPGYFNTMGTRFVAGRDFIWGDLYGSASVYHCLGEFRPRELGVRCCRYWQARPSIQQYAVEEVIGVVQDVRHNGVNEKAPDIVYWPAMLNNPYTSKPTD